MRFSEIDFTYLSTSVERIGTALAELTGYKVANIPTEYRPALNEKADDPLWVMEAMQVQPTDRNADQSTQVWTVLSQLIYKPVQMKFDAEIYTSMYTVAPRCLGFMQAYKGLKFDDDQERIRFLDSSQVVVTVEGLNQSGQAGFTLVHRLPFRITIEQEYA